MKLAGRLAHIAPFYVMACAKVAQEIARSPECDPALGGEPMIYLNIGEPDFTAPRPVVLAAEAALRAGRSQYTDAVGLPALRERISQWYATRWGVDVPARRIVVTAGASAGLQLICQALFESGDEVLMPDPSYPCNRHFVAATGATARLVPTTPATRFQLDADAVRSHWRPQTRGVLLATPSNPTGTSIVPDELARIVDVVREKGGVAIVDEIYQGLSYDPGFERCALALGDDIVSVNSFSKYFGMTGWRLAGLARGAGRAGGTTRPEPLHLRQFHRPARGHRVLRRRQPGRMRNPARGVPRAP
jgi:aspartate/methionine/tyrosine aminotransferase